MHVGGCGWANDGRGEVVSWHCGRAGAMDVWLGGSIGAELHGDKWQQGRAVWEGGW